MNSGYTLREMTNVISVAKLNEHYELCGGVPRSVFCNNTTVVKHKLESAVLNIDIETLKKAMYTVTTLIIPNISLSLLEAAPCDNYSQATISFASSYIKDLVYAKHQESCISLLREVIQESSKFTNFSTTLYEQVVHVKIPKGVDLQLIQISSRSVVNLSIPCHKSEIYYTDHSTIVPGTYYSTRSCFPSIDSFFLTDDKKTWPDLVGSPGCF